jgi:hypothetical protein
MFALAWYGVFSLLMATQSSAEGVSSAAFWSASVSALSW